MKNEIKDFILNKKINYEIVREENFYDFFKESEEPEDYVLVNSNRDHVFAMDNKKVVGFAILFNQEKSIREPLKNVITLSNIVVDENYRNQGIATNMINLLLNDVNKKRI